MKSDFTTDADINAAKEAIRHARAAKKVKLDADKGIFKTNNPCDYCDQASDVCKYCREFEKFIGKRMRVMIPRRQSGT